jgi:hypothetical protein
MIIDHLESGGRYLVAAIDLDLEITILAFARLSFRRPNAAFAQNVHYPVSFGFVLHVLNLLLTASAKKSAGYGQNQHEQQRTV